MKIDSRQSYTLLFVAGADDYLSAVTAFIRLGGGYSFLKTYASLVT